MDKKFLDKVVDQIVRETTIDYDNGRIDSPFTVFYHSDLIMAPTAPTYYFTTHCIDVYGLNDLEVEYVWNEYKNIIKDKINNGK